MKKTINQKRLQLLKDGKIALRNNDPKLAAKICNEVDKRVHWEGNNKFYVCFVPRILTGIHTTTFPAHPTEWFYEVERWPVDPARK